MGVRGGPDGLVKSRTSSLVKRDLLRSHDRLPHFLVTSVQEPALAPATIAVTSAKD
jgi:hypothetical protein